MAYTTINKSTDHFNTKLYTGTGSSNAITGVGFQPDFTWIKITSEANNHELYDAVRGVTKRIYSDQNSAEDTNSYGLTAFGTDGFTVSTGNAVNKSSGSFASFNWKANGAGSSNSDGDITATVSANTTSGFSIVKYTGNGSSGATVGHGLGSDVKMVMCKGLGDTYGWKVFHTNLTSGKTLVLNTNAAEDTDANRIASANASTFTTSGTFSVNESGSDYVAYCFAEKTGFSKFGSYTGNGNANGAFIYTGFKPAFIIIKRIDATENWVMENNKSRTYNPSYDFLLADSSSNPSPGAADNYQKLDILSNGFKSRTTSVYSNASGGTYIYMAFAAAPLIGSNNVPCTAR
jgi:hypothetical protein|tara:strand:- start:13 stop:1053 length:1041 start_codon:yes stop_codon:yes gene_type:complete